MKTLPNNFEIHFFRGDPGKGQDPWMYSIRGDNKGYRRGLRGGDTILDAAVRASLDVEFGGSERMNNVVDMVLLGVKKSLRVILDAVLEKT